MANNAFSSVFQLDGSNQIGAVDTLTSKVLTEVYEEPFLNAVDNETSFLKRLKRKPGKDIAIYRTKARKTGNASHESYEEDDAIGAAGRQTFENLVETMRMHRIMVEISALAEAEGRARGSLVNLKADEMENAIDDLSDYLNDQALGLNASGVQIYTAPGKNMNGLSWIVDDTDVAAQPYGNLDRGDNAWFVPEVLRNGNVLRPVTVGLMAQMDAELKKPDRKAKTEVILGAQTVVDSYADIADSRRRYASGGGPVAIDLGHGKLAYNGIPVEAVPNLGVDAQVNAAYNLFWLDMRDYFLWVSLTFKVDEIKRETKDTTLFVTKAWMQVICESPFRQGRITDLNVA